MSKLKLKDKILERILNNKYFRNLIMEDMSPIGPLPGLYDASGNMLCTWDESGINIQKNYVENDWNNSPTSPSYVIDTIYTSTTKIVTPKETTSIGNRAFEYCDNIVNVELSEGITSIGDWTFIDCRKLANISMPSTLKRIGTRTFQGCTALTSIKLPEGLTTIGENAFTGCNNLTSLVIPSTLTSISKEMLTFCSKLRTIYYTGTQAQWNAISKGKDWNYDCPATIVYNYIPE